MRQESPDHRAGVGDGVGSWAPPPAVASAFQQGHVNQVTSEPPGSGLLRPGELQLIKHRRPAAGWQRRGTHAFPCNYKPSDWCERSGGASLPASRFWSRPRPSSAGGLGRSLLTGVTPPLDAAGHPGSGPTWPPPPRISQQNSAESTQRQQHSKSFGFTLTCTSRGKLNAA